MASNKIKNATDQETTQEAKVEAPVAVTATFLQPLAPEGECFLWEENNQGYFVRFYGGEYTTQDPKEIEALRGKAKFGIVEKE